MELWQERFERWKEKVSDEALLTELAAMDEAQREDAFYRELEFGTGGLRGVLGAGSNRMNIHVVARATQGIADYLRTLTEKTQFIIITHRRGTMEEADVLYGVTMQEQGVSKLLELKTAELAKSLGITE